MAYTTIQMNLLHSLIPSYPTINLKYIVKYGSKHCANILPKELEMIVIMEDINDQIIKQNGVEFGYICNKRLIPEKHLLLII